jgi:hypothetical protein
MAKMKKKAAQEDDRKKSLDQNMDVLDSYEAWLQRQPLKDTRAKSGFIGTLKIEVSP